MITDIVVSIALLCSYLTGMPALDCRNYVKSCADTTAKETDVKHAEAAAKAAFECRKNIPSVAIITRRQAELMAYHYYSKMFKPPSEITNLKIGGMATTWYGEIACEQMPVLMSQPQEHLHACFEKFKKGEK
jgi:hypothetical protein